MSDGVNPSGNPQGKGLVMVLQQIAAAAPAEIRAKSTDQALLDYWCSSLVLSSAFKFRVVPDQTYFLYRADQEWQLSLVSPVEWGDRLPGDFVAECALGRDMTWKLSFHSELSGGVRQALIQFLEGFQSQAESSKKFRRDAAGLRGTSSLPAARSCLCLEALTKALIAAGWRQWRWVTCGGS